MSTAGQESTPLKKITPAAAAGPKKRRRRAGHLDFTTIQITPPRKGGGGLHQLAFARPKFNDIDPSKAFFNVRLPAHVNVIVEKPTPAGEPPSKSPRMSVPNERKFIQPQEVKFQEGASPSSWPNLSPPAAGVGGNQTYYINGDIIIPPEVFLPSNLKEDLDLEALSLDTMKSLKIFDDSELKAIESFSSGEKFDTFDTESAGYQHFFRNILQEFQIDPNSMIDYFSPTTSTSEIDFLSL